MVTMRSSPPLFLQGLTIGKRGKHGADQQTNKEKRNTDEQTNKQIKRRTNTQDRAMVTEQSGRV